MLKRTPHVISLSALVFRGWVPAGLVFLACTSPSGTPLLGKQAVPPTEQTTTQVVIREDEDDPFVWETVRSFQLAPTEENTEASLRFLEEKLQDWNSHPPGVVTTILEAVAKHHVELGRAYLLRFLVHDPALPSSTHIASYAAMALGELGGDGAFEALAQAAQHGSIEVLDSIAVALGLLEDRRAIMILETLASRPEPSIRGEALRSLAKFCSASSAHLAVKSLADPNERVRGSAVWWFAQCGTAADALRLANLLTDGEELLRVNALRGLIRLNSRSGCAHLQALLSDGSATVRELARAYENVCRDE